MRVFGPNHSSVLLVDASHLVSQSPLLKIAYTSKRVLKTYKSGQGREFRADFDAAAQPVESEGFCHRQLTSLANFYNSRNDLCGRVTQVSTGVGFVLQIDFVETSPDATTWSWYLGLPFRGGSGGVIVLDGQIVQEFMGVTTFWGGVVSKAMRVDMQVAPGPHVVQIYGLSQTFESSSVLFSRESSPPVAVSISALSTELLKWVALSDADASVAAVAQKERAPRAADVARGLSTLQLHKLSTDAQFAIRLRSVANANCRFTDSFNSSSRVSVAYLPARASASARAAELATSITQKAKWDVVPGLTTPNVANTGPGVLLCMFSGRFFVDDTTTKAFTLDLAFAVNRSALSTAVLAPQYRVDSSFVQPSSAALDFSMFLEVPDSSTTGSSSLNVSLSYLFAAAKSAKIVGGRISTAFLPGASLVTVQVENTVASQSLSVFARDVQVSVPSTLVIRATAVICRNGAAEQLTARISKSGSVVFDGVFSSVSSSVAAGSCEPMVLHAVVDAAIGTHKIALDVTTTTKLGFQMKNISAQIVSVDRGALMSLEECTSACAQHNLCKSGVHSKASSACSLFMARTESNAIADTSKTTFVRVADPSASESLWTTLDKRRWEMQSTTSLLIKCNDDAACASFGCASARTIAERCRCVCHASSDCVGFSFENERCFQVTSAALRQMIATRSYARAGTATIHLNIPRSCSAIKSDAPKALSGMYVIATSVGLVRAFCEMTADAAKGYTVVPCDFASSGESCRASTGPSDYDSCKEMGLAQVVPRSPSHFIALHKTFGAAFFATVPGISNAVLNTKLELPSDHSATSQWTAVDGGKWWLRDFVGTADDAMTFTTRATKKLWLAMHAYADAQSVSDGIALAFDSRGTQTAKYLCSPNDATPSTIWRTVLQNSFNGNSDDNLWVTSWSSATAGKWDQLCQGISFLGGPAFTRPGAYVEKTVSQLGTGFYASNVRIAFTYYFAFKPSIWSLLQRVAGAGDARVIRVYLGSRLVREEPIDSSNAYYCTERSRSELVFFRARRSFVARGVTTTGGSLTLRVAVDFGSFTALSFGIDEVSMDMDFTFQSPLGLSPETPAMSCYHLKTERAATGDPNPDGRYYVQLDAVSAPVYVPCSDGWLVAQRRTNGNLGFNRKWKEYRDGFGVGSSSEWWIGNDLLAAITKRLTEAMVVLSKAQMSSSAYYADLRVAGAEAKYLLRVRGYSAAASTAADALSALNNSYFSTSDSDNDRAARFHCARRARSGFWFGDCLSTKSDLNAPYDVVPPCTTFAPWARGWCKRTGGIVWNSVDGYDASTLLLRPSSCPLGHVPATTSACAACPAGTYGESYATQCTSCPAGTYSASVAATSVSACFACPAGFQCPTGASAPVACAIGTYSVAGAGACAAAPEGFAAPRSRMTAQELVACTNGSYSAPGQSRCSSIPAGFYCSGATTTASCGLRNLQKCPTARVYCPRGNTGPLAVPPGHYSVTSRSAALRCPPGYFCQHGVKKMCPATRFGIAVGLSQPLCSGRCASGCVCAPGSVSACPATSTSAAQVVIAPASISYAIAPLAAQSDSGSNSDPTFAAASTETLDLFEFTDVNASRFRSSWSGGVAHNITLSYFERATNSPTLELQLPVAGFDKGVRVLVDGNELVKQTTASALTFSFASTNGPHIVLLIGAESAFRAKRSMLFRRVASPASASTPNAFETLRCDLLDTQPIHLDVDISVCASAAPSCTTAVRVNGRTLREANQATNLVLVVTLSAQGALATSAAVDASSADRLAADLSASSSPGTFMLVVGISVRNDTLGSALSALLVKYGANSDKATGVSGSFVFVGDRSTGVRPWVEFTAVTSGSSYRLLTSIPLIKAGEFYAPMAVPSGYYSVPEAAPSHRRDGFRKCPSGFTCAGGEKIVTLAFANATVCTGQQQLIAVPEATQSYVSPMSFALAAAPASVSYSLVLDETSALSTHPFMLNTETKIALTQALDYETLNAYDLVLLVNDTASSVVYAACKIRVGVVDVNEPPVILNAGFTIRTKENTLPPVVLSPALSVVDPDAFEAFKFAIVSGGNGNFAMNAYGSVVVTKALDFETRSSYALNVSVTDLGGLSAFGTVTIAVDDVPEAPQCSSASFSVSEAAALNTEIGDLKTVTLDPDASDVLTFTLVTQSPLGAMSVNPTTGKILLLVPLNYEAADSMSLRIQVTDSTGRHDTCDYAIAVLDVNDDPVLSSGVFDVLEACTGDDCLIGALSAFAFDEDSGSSFTFTLKNISDVVAIQGDQLWATAKIDYETTPVLFVSVSVSDGRGGSATNTMIINVVDVNEAPAGIAFSISVVENQAVGAVVHRIVCPDPEGDAVEFAIVNATDGFHDLFTLDGDAIVVASAIDYEALATRSLTLFVRVCDALGLCSDIGPNVVVITDGSDAPVFAAAMNATVEENARIGTLVGDPVTAVDQDAGQTATLVYDIVAGDPFRQFTISPSTGQLSLAAALDVNIVQLYALRIRATDADGKVGISDPVPIQVLDSPSPPYFVDTLELQSYYPVDVSRLSDGSYGKVALAVDDRDPDQVGGVCSIQADASGMFTIEVSDDFTQCNVSSKVGATLATGMRYNITVRVTDTEDLSSFSQIVLGIMSRGLNTAPQCTSARFELMENTAQGSFVGRVVGSDRDVSDTVLFAITRGDDVDMFHINESSGALTVGTNLSDYETTSQVTLVISVQDDAPAPLSSECRVTIAILNEIEPPVCAPAVAFNLTENNAPNALVGTALWTSCVDQDTRSKSPSSFAFEIQDASSDFAISRSTGQLSVLRALNFEARASHSISVVVRNARLERHSTVIAVSIQILDANDAPQVAFAPVSPSSSVAVATLPESAPSGSTVAIVTVTDEDAGDTSTVVLSDPSSLFALVQLNVTTYELKTTDAIDFETQSQFALSVTAKDRAGALARATFTVQVLDVDEIPFFAPRQHFFIEENAGLGTLAKQRFQFRGACNDTSVTSSGLGMSSSVSIGACLQRCAKQAQCKSAVFDDASSSCVLLTEAPVSCEPCSTCQRYDVQTGGRSLRSLSLIPESSYVYAMPANITTAATGLTLELWVCVRANEGTVFTYAKSVATKTRVNVQLAYSSDSLRVVLFDVPISTTVTLTQDVWYHIAVTFDSITSDAIVYLNGAVLSQTRILSLSGAKCDTSGELIIGSCFRSVACSPKPFAFSIDEVQAKRSSSVATAMSSRLTALCCLCCCGFECGSFVFGAKSRPQRRFDEAWAASKRTRRRTYWCTIGAIDHYEATSFLSSGMRTEALNTLSLLFYGSRFENSLNDASGAGNTLTTRSDQVTASFADGSASIWGESPRLSTRWRLVVESDAGSGPLGIAELAWFSERKKLNLATSLATYAASDGSDLALMMDSNKNTVAFLKSTTTDSGKWIELTFRTRVDASKVSLQTAHSSDNCVATIAIQYFDAVAQQWTFVSYLRGLEYPRTSVSAYGTSTASVVSTTCKHV